MKRVYLIRHGLPDFPDGNRMCLGSTDLPLGPEGFDQARAMAETLPRVGRVFSSPLTRAVQTAQAIGLPIQILEDLRELDAGDWDGLTFQEIRTRFAELYAARGIDPTLPIPGSEDRGEGGKRFLTAMELAARTAETDFAVVAHGGVIFEFLKAVTGEGRKPDYAEVISLRWQDGRFYLLEDETDA